MSEKTNSKAHVICLNDSVECVVVDAVEVAEAMMAGLRNLHRERNMLICDDEYNTRHYWHIHTIPAFGEGLSVETVGGESIEVESPDTNKNLISKASLMHHCIRRILDDLPANRDWLDPGLEKLARSLVYE